MTARSVLLAGGGTAGHVSPLLALADCLRALLDPALAGGGNPWGALVVLPAWAVAGIALTVRTFHWE